MTAARYFALAAKCYVIRSAGPDADHLKAG